MARYRSDKKPDAKFVPQEHEIPLLEPVRIYTALELRDMPLSKMNAAIKAQEEYYFLESSTQMGGAAINVRRAMQNGQQLIQIVEKSRIRYRIGGEFIEPRIIRQLAKRGLVRLG